MADQLTDAVVRVNDDQMGIVPGSLRYSEGLGERRILPVSEGGGRVSQVFATNQETAMGKVRFALRSTPDNIAAVRAWQQRRNRNVVLIESEDGLGNRLVRSFTQAAITNDPEIPFSPDGTIELEWGSNTAV